MTGCSEQVVSADARADGDAPIAIDLPGSGLDVIYPAGVPAGVLAPASIERGSPNLDGSAAYGVGAQSTSVNIVPHVSPVAVAALLIGIAVL
jgi:hypothetical protein